MAQDLFGFGEKDRKGSLEENVKKSSTIALEIIEKKIGILKEPISLFHHLRMLSSGPDIPQ